MLPTVIADFLKAPLPTVYDGWFLRVRRHCPHRVRPSTYRPDMIRLIRRTAHVRAGGNSGTVGNTRWSNGGTVSHTEKTTTCIAASTFITIHSCGVHTYIIPNAFLDELSSVMQIRITDLVHSIQGGDPRGQGTWVHPQVAIHLAQWLSPAFSVQVTQWVLDWHQGVPRSYMPIHVQRFIKNRSKIPHTHFSMLNEIYLNLLAPLEDCGVIPPDKMMPDISTGRMFSDFLRRKGIDPSRFPTYEHEFADDSRMPVQARLYPVEHLPDFRRYFNEVWLPDRAESYFAEKCPKALPFLPRILQLPA